jgi:hypothetical protein
MKKHTVDKLREYWHVGKFTVNHLDCEVCGKNINII